MRKITLCLLWLLLVLDVMAGQGLVSVRNREIENDPVWINDDFFTDVIRNPVEINDLNNQFLYLSSNMSPNYKFSSLYCKKINDINLAMFLRKYDNIYTIRTKKSSSITEYEYKYNQEFSFVSLILGKDNIAFSYSFYTKDGDDELLRTDLYENTYYDDFTTQEKVNSIKKNNHELKIGWKKAINKEKTLNLLSEFSIGNGNYKGSYSYQELLDGDPDEDGEYDDFYHDGHSDVVVFNRNFDEEYQYSCPDFSIALSGRILRKITSEKRTSLICGVKWEYYNTDYRNSMFEEDCAITFLVENYQNMNDSLFTEYSSFSYTGNTIKYSKLSGFIGYGKNWIFKKKFNFLFGCKSLISSLNDNKRLISNIDSSDNYIKDRSIYVAVYLPLKLEYTINRNFQIHFEQNLLFAGRNGYYYNREIKFAAELYNKRLVGLKISPFRHNNVNFILDYYCPYELGNTIFLTLRYNL